MSKPHGYPAPPPKPLLSSQPKKREFTTCSVCGKEYIPEYEDAFCPHELLTALDSMPRAMSQDEVNTICHSASRVTACPEGGCAKRASCVAAQEQGAAHPATPHFVGARCYAPSCCSGLTCTVEPGVTVTYAPGSGPGVEQCPVCGDKYITHEDSPDRQSPDCPHNLIKGACGTVPHDGVLDDAKRIINDERAGQYGPAENSFKCIADMWTAYIQMRHPAQSADVGPVVLSARDVAIMMVLLKCAREANAPKRDSLVDLCGYGALAADLE